VSRAWFAAAAVIILFARAARADKIADARADYEAGASAYDRKDYANAATRFSRADEKVPNARALQLAMASALHLSDPSLAMNLVERAESRSSDGALQELARRLRQRFGSEAGRIRVTCPSSGCHPSIDGKPFDPALPRWVAPGPHHVQVRGDAGGVLEKDVRVTPGGTIELAPTAEELASPASPTPPAAEAASSEVAPATELPPAQHPPVAPAERHGLSPIFFWSGVAVTGAALATASVLTIIAANRHDEFVANRGPETAQAGEVAQTNAAIGWAVTGGFLLTTLVFALITDFHAKKPTATSHAGLGDFWRPAGARIP
jgi:hypothetical protein